MLILTIAGTALLSSAFGVLLGYVAWHSNEEVIKEKPRIIRKGIMYYTYHWDLYTNGDWNYRKRSYDKIKHSYTDKVTIILHEMEVIADQSKVIIYHIDNAWNEANRNAIIKRVGDYVKTSEVEWDKPIDYEPETQDQSLDKYMKGLEEELGTFDKEAVKKTLQKVSQ